MNVDKRTSPSVETHSDLLRLTSHKQSVQFIIAALHFYKFQFFLYPKNDSISDPRRAINAHVQRERLKII